MKNIIALVVMMCITLTMSAQELQTSTFTPVTIDQDPRTYSAPRQEVRPQVVKGYRINNRGAFEVVRLKITITSNGYGPVVSVVGYYNKNYGQWFSTYAIANKVSISDPAVIKENFDYKSFLNILGQVYF